MCAISAFILQPSSLILAAMRFPFDLIAFDLDDTLLLPSGELSTRSKAALEELNRRGVVVALASGRMLPTMTPIADALSFAPAIVSYNGAQVNLKSDESPLYHCPVPPEVANRVLDYALGRGLHLHFYYDNRLFTTSVDDWKARIYREQTGAHLEYEPNFERFRGLEPTKLIIVDEAENVEAMLRECEEKFRGEVTVTRSKPIYLEFLHPAVNKGAGFKALCDKLHIPLERTAAFGDSYNDIEMLQLAGQSVAMENGLDAAKNVAKQICPSNEDDGVAQVLEQWIAQ
jgi:Cof subfamily protein (haloacid dehalogenase superfamily)